MLFKKAYKRIADDDFLKRLPATLVGAQMLHPGNPWLMNEAIKNMPQGSVVEIGSYGGMSLALIWHLMKKHGRDNALFSCDPWIYEGFKDQAGNIESHMDGRVDVRRMDYMLHIKQCFESGIKLLCKERLPHTFYGTSKQFFDGWKNGAVIESVFGNPAAGGGAIAFIYIDGDHAYESAKQDFEMALPFLVSGSFVLLDDSGDGMPFGSAKFAKELHKTSSLELVATNPNYLFKVK